MPIFKNAPPPRAASNPRRGAGEPPSAGADTLADPLESAALESESPSSDSEEAVSEVLERAGPANDGATERLAGSSATINDAGAMSKKLDRNIDGEMDERVWRELKRRSGAQVEEDEVEEALGGQVRGVGKMLKKNQDNVVDKSELDGLLKKYT